MDIGTIMQVAGIGILISATCQILNKYGKDEQATLLSLVGIVVVLIMLISRIGELYETIREVFGL